MSADPGPAVRDTLPPLTVEQLAPAYQEAIASPDIRVTRLDLQLIWDATLPSTRGDRMSDRTHQDRDEVKARAEADFLGLYLDHGGRRRGKALLCPFHEDHWPSASIHRGRFHCFTCNLSLDVFAFVARAQRTDFKGALSYLADRYGVPLNTRVLTDAERREYGRRRAAAEREAAELVEWREDMLLALRRARNWRLESYHRAKQLIITHGLDHPMGGVWADAADICEREYLDLDRRIDLVEQAAVRDLLVFFRSRRAAA
jgi:hypothetical protein